MSLTHSERLKLAELSLLGLSVGDALGQQFFVTEDKLEHYLTHRQLPPNPWYFTDDTVIDLLYSRLLTINALIFSLVN